MPCKLCGDVCRCSPISDSAADLTLLPDPQPLEAPSATGSGEAAPEDPSVWRQEVAARLNRYQSRRKPRPPRYPSLLLRFEEDDANRPAGSPSEFSALPQIANNALAFDEFAVSAPPAFGALPSAPRGPAEDEMSLATLPPTTAKIIEFPRSWTPAPPPLDELADPVVLHPGILEAPGIVPPPPALGGITIEPAQLPELARRPGVDIPLQSAPLSQRILSAAIDDLIIAAACAVFAFIFWKLTAVRPPRLEAIAVLAALAGVFWAAYQYLLMVYSGTTPGLRLAGLELARFDGNPAPRSLRRWRVLASFLSASSLGMGYAWVFLDEDALCWHDRITHTYLAPKA